MKAPPESSGLGPHSTIFAGADHRVEKMGRCKNGKDKDLTAQH